MEEAAVDADIMHIATVEGKIGRTEILLPLPAVECLAILYGYHTPVTGGIEDIGYQDISVGCQLPVFGIFLTVEIGLGTEDGHLLALIPKGSLVIAVADTGTHKTIDIISVRGAADVDVRLPDIATGSSMTMLHHILALIIDLVVAGKMSMAAEEFIASLKLLQQRE